MGFFQNLLGVTPNEDVNKVDAAVAPYNYQAVAQPFDFFGTTSVTRAQAMQVPAVARARNIMCATIGSLPLEVRRESNNSKVTTPPFIRQPDPRMTAQAVYTFLAEDLLFTGQGYLRIMELGADGRPLSAEWISVSRVTRELDFTGLNSNQGYNVTGYSVDGKRVPNYGLGSLIPFTGYDEGLLVRAGTTILTALALEKAVKRFADEPTPNVVLKSNLPMPAERVTALLNSWKEARNTRGTAFVNDTIDFQAIGFSPEQMTLNQSRQYMASEIARAVNIPEWYIGANAGGSMTYSNTIQERRSLVDFSLKPLMTCITQRLSDIDITPRGSYVKFDLSEFYAPSALERADIFTKLIPLGVMTVEEARIEEDLINE
jgi:HK97 family phage portal protein